MTTFKLTLNDLRALPLDQVLVSAVVSLTASDLKKQTETSELNAVGGIAEKLAVANEMPNQIRMVAVAKEQNKKEPIPDQYRVAGSADRFVLNHKRPIIQANCLADLAQQISHHFGPRRFGKALELPEDLNAGSNTHNPYHPDQHQQRGWTHQRISDFVAEESTVGGYILLTAGPAWGKTAWSLDWMRASSGAVQQPAAFCPLSGWSFIRQGAGDEFESDVRVLLGLEHRTRLRLNLPFATEKEEGSFPTTHEGDPLREHFAVFLKDCGDYCNASGKNVVLLLDAVDEIFGPMGSLPSHLLPNALPNELPKGVFIVLTSRPGQHLSWKQGKQPRLLLLDMNTQVSEADAQTQQRLDALQLIWRYAARWAHGRGGGGMGDVDIDSAILLDPRYRSRETWPTEEQLTRQQSIEKDTANLGGTDSSSLNQLSQFTQRLLETSQTNLHYIRTLLDEAGLEQTDDYQQAEMRRPDPVNRFKQLSVWRDHPEKMPSGINELMARSYARLWLSQDDTNVRKRAITAIALAACLRVGDWSVADLTNLLYNADDGVLYGGATVGAPDYGITDIADAPHAIPNAKLLGGDPNEFAEALRLGRPFWTGPRGRQDDAFITLRFSHLLLRDCAIAAYEVLANRHWSLEVSEDNQELLLAKEIANAVKQMHENALQYDHVTRQGVSAWLYQALGRASSRFWRSDVKPQIRSGTDLKRIPRITSYALTWGVLHALRGGAVHRELGQRALALLINAAHLQSAIRAAPGQAFDALSESYVLADLMGEKIESGDPSKMLRIRVESELLQHEAPLSSDQGLLSVGACLHNRLGGGVDAKNAVEKWKDSIDIKALITNPPGTPSAFLRMLYGYSNYAVSPCGQWMVGTGEGKLCLWDMRQGWHRPQQVCQPWFGSFQNVQCIDANGIVVIAAAQRSDIWLTACDPISGQLAEYLFEGHTFTIRSISLRTAVAGEDTLLLVASGSGDRTIGLLAQPLNTLRQPQSPEAKKTSLHLFEGHTGPINSITLRTAGAGNDTLLLVASGSGDKTIGLLAQPLSAIREPQSPESKKTSLHLFEGHTGPINSIALRTAVVGNETLLLVASGSGDRTIGLLAQPLSTIRQPQSPESKKTSLHLFEGHTRTIRSITLRTAVAGEDTLLLVASGSDDKTIGLLAQPMNTLRQPQSPEAKKTSLHLFKGHTGVIHSIALRTAVAGEDTLLLVASGSGDRTIGLLAQPLNTLRQAQSPEPKKTSLHIFEGHKDWIDSITLRTAVAGEDTLLLVASGSGDRTIGLLAQPLSTIRQPQSPESKKTSLHLFEGHAGAIYPIALHTVGAGNDTLLLAASGSGDKNIGLLAQPLNTLRQAQSPESKKTSLHLFEGHTSGITSIALRTAVAGNDTLLLVASGSWDKTIGLLAQPLSTIRQPQRLEAKKTSLHLFEGHTHLIHSIALRTAVAGEDTLLLVASGSADKTVGLLAQPLNTVRQPQSPKSKETSLHLFEGHTGGIRSIAMHTAVVEEDTLLLVASGGEDKSIGLLAQPLNIIRQPQSPESKKTSLHLFEGHTDWINSIALRIAVAGNDTQLLVASGSWDKTIGLLAQPLRGIQDKSALPAPLPDKVLCASLPLQSSFKVVPCPWNGEHSVATIQSRSITFGNINAGQPWVPTLICPLINDGIDWHAMTRAGDNEVVLAGSQGCDIVLLLLELINGDYS